ncbi:tyramine receptor Ser-2 [Rhagoletis pomonella]|uniref:tyramine receptor Ser-2 n=1 Tax=Rhagoletis pomonella TaxID=28610 RepID=UPI0017813E77|nr:tyramine receptor Ser-2 [Rhagoletis pomonella]
MAFVVENRDFIERAARIYSIGKNDNASDHIHNSTENCNDDCAEADYPAILKETLTTFTCTERIAFGTVVWILFVISLCGNVGTLHVNFRRKIRPFHRASLISLAVSDLMNTIFLAVPYMSKFSTQFVELWILGSTMCHLVPFLTTVAILVSSMTLVGIALDRYFAVMRAVISFWNPGAIFCVLSMLTIWATSMGISYPALRVYNLYPVYILTVATDANVDGSLENFTTDSSATLSSTETTFTSSPIVAIDTQSGWEQEAFNKNVSYIPVTQDALVIMCACAKSTIITYYFIVFYIIFLPSIIAFVWINAVIAKQLWNRRHTAAAIDEKQSNEAKHFRKRQQIQSGGVYLKKSDDKEDTKEPAIFNLATISSSVAAVEYARVNGPNPRDPSHISAKPYILTCTPAQLVPTKPYNNREARHIRMFIVIIVLISTFLCLRLPAWIFLLIRLHGYDAPHMESCLNFAFGILNLTSSMLNPFLYTYLSETIKIAHTIKRTVRKVVCGCGLRQQKHNHAATRPTATYGGCDCGGIPLEHSTRICCGSRWLDKFGFCTQKLLCEFLWSNSNNNKEPIHLISDDGPKVNSSMDANEKDEGIDCGAESIDSDKQISPGLLMSSSVKIPM